MSFISDQVWWSVQISDYEKELETMKNMSQEEYVAHVRRYSLMKHNCLWTICYCLFFLDQKYPVDYCAYVKSRYKFTEHIWEELWVPLYMEGTAPSCVCVHARTLRPIMWRNGGIGYFILCWGHLYNWFVSCGDTRISGRVVVSLEELQPTEEWQGDCSLHHSKIICSIL